MDEAQWVWYYLNETGDVPRTRTDNLQRLGTL